MTINDSANVIWLGLAGSFVASLGTAVGAAGVLAIRSLSQKLEDSLLSIAAGIMLAACFFSLLQPAIDYGLEYFGDTSIAILFVIAGLLTGAVALHLIHHVVPHEHFFLGREGPEVKELSRIWLFVIAITLHNFPEGMAVGVGFAGGNIDNGTSLAAGIGIQNIPEGLAVAVSLISVGYSRLHAFSVGAISGLAEPIGGLFGSIAGSLAAPLFPFAMGFAAGAMLFIISDEIIPETHRSGFENIATFSLLGGFAIMMYLDAVLG